MEIVTILLSYEGYLQHICENNSVNFVIKIVQKKKYTERKWLLILGSSYSVKTFIKTVGSWIVLRTVNDQTVYLFN